MHIDGLTKFNTAPQTTPCPLFQASSAGICIALSRLIKHYTVWDQNPSWKTSSSTAWLTRTFSGAATFSDQLRHVSVVYENPNIRSHEVKWLGEVHPYQHNCL